MLWQGTEASDDAIPGRFAGEGPGTHLAVWTVLWAGGLCYFQSGHWRLLPLHAHVHEGLRRQDRHVSLIVYCCRCCCLTGLSVCQSPGWLGIKLQVTYCHSLSLSHFLFFSFSPSLSLCLFLYLSVSLSLCVSESLTFCLSFSPSLSVCLPVCLCLSSSWYNHNGPLLGIKHKVSLSVCLSVCLSVSLSLSSPTLSVFLYRYSSQSPFLIVLFSLCLCYTFWCAKCLSTCLLLFVCMLCVCCHCCCLCVVVFSGGCGESEDCLSSSFFFFWVIGNCH